LLAELKKKKEEEEEEGGAAKWGSFSVKIEAVA
jgi:hypothetical protein